LIRGGACALKVSVNGRRFTCELTTAVARMPRENFGTNLRMMCSLLGCKQGV
jgi:hypothetical protein